MNVKIQIATDEPLQLPWNWLALNLPYAPAAGLRHYSKTHAPQLQHPEPDAQQREQEWHANADVPAARHLEAQTRQPAQLFELAQAC